MYAKFFTAAHTMLGGVTIAVREIRGSTPGPTSGLVSGVHGRELSSVGGLLTFLKEAEQRRYDFCGTIVAIPFVNPVALMQKDWYI